MNSPSVSIIIPNYNHEIYLEERIRSVLNQTFQDFEIIILDDCSTDNSEAIFNNYKGHPKLSHFIINKENSGSPFIQWKKGIELASGEFIWIAETDDYAEPDFLEKTVSVLNENPDSVLVYSDSKIIDSKGDELGFWSDRKNTFFNTNKWSYDHEANGIDEIINYFFYKVTINNVSAVLFRKNSLLTLNFKTLVQNKNVGDLVTYIHIALYGQVSYISKPLNNFRTHALSTTKANLSNGTIYYERIKCYTETLDQLFMKKMSKERMQNLKKAFKYIIRKNSFSVLDFGYKKELFLLLNKLKAYNVFNTFDNVYYIFTFKLYLLNLLKSKQISKSLIKKRTELE